MGWLAGVDLRLIVVTDRRLAERPLPEVVAAVLDAGGRTILLREKDLPREERLALAEGMRALGATVIVGGTDPLGGEAVHLASGDVLGHQRVAALTGRSCHDMAEVMASKENYVTLSPIYASESKPGHGPALGVGALGPGTRKKVVALGGIDTRARAQECRAAGFTGVAVMGAVMRAADPARVVRELLS